MLIVFKSRACADLIMIGTSGKEILQIIGKRPDDRQGIVTIDQLPEAITLMQAAMITDKDETPDPPEYIEESVDDDETAIDDATMDVGLYRRIVPVLTLFERSLAAATPVTWES